MRVTGSFSAILAGTTATMALIGSQALAAEPNLDELRRLIELQQQQIEMQRQQMEQQNRALEVMQSQLKELQQARQEPPAGLQVPPGNQPLPAPQPGAVADITDADGLVVQPSQFRIGDMAKGGPPEEYFAPAQAVTAGDFPGSIKLPGTDTSFKIGGYAKLDVIHDFDDIGSEDLFVTSAINVDGDRNGRTRLHARQSRLNVDVRTPTEIGDARIFLEGDFFGSGGNQLVSNSTSFRLRHAFGQVSNLFDSSGNVLAGQTWGTFMDVSALPETIDFEGPNAESFIRQGQVRWTQLFGDGISVALAIENPEGDILNDGGLNLDQIPDVVARGRWDQDWGHLQAGFVGRQIRFDDGDDDESEFGYGINASGKIGLPFLHEKDNLRFQAQYGDGIGRYIVDLAGGGFDAQRDPTTGDLETVTAFGAYGAVQHWWTDNLRSNAVYGYVKADNADFVPGDTFESSQYVAVNLIWSPIPRIDAGIEYLWGQRENDNGRSGTANRIQLGFLFRF